MVKDLLSDEAVVSALPALPGWRSEGKALVKQFVCKGFGGALSLVVKTALLAERADHHPDILVQFSKVTFTLSSHDVLGISARDLLLAKAIDEASAP